jgi:MFS family permease
VIRRPALVLALLTALNLLNYLDRFVLSAVLPKVQDDLHLSNFTAGSLATVFLIGYFATSPVFGLWADRTGTGGRSRLLALGIAVWSAATLASGLVTTTAGLVAARALVGVGEASYATIAPTLLDDMAPAGKRGRWMAIFYSATPIGSALGYIVGGRVQSVTGSWRAAFLVAGAPGIALALLCLLVAEAPRTAAAGLPKPWVAGRVLLGISRFARSVLGYCAYTFAMGGFAFWAPKYIYARYGVEPGRASFRFGLVTVAAGLVGTLAGGWLGDARVRAIEKRGGAAPGSDAAAVGGSLEVCVLSAALGAPLAAGAVAASSAPAFFAWAFVSEAALFLSSGPINVVLLRSVPLAQRASAMALSIFAIHLLGDLWSPPLIGLVADHAPMAWAMMAVPLGFGAGAFVWWWARRSPDAARSG